MSGPYRSAYLHTPLTFHRFSFDLPTARLRGVLNGEGERSAGQRVKITRLQQNMKDVKDRNESLELQLSVLRKRIAESDEIAVCRGGGGGCTGSSPLASRGAASAAPQKSQTSLAVSGSILNAEREKRRLMKQLDHTKTENANLLAENAKLKSELLEFNQQSVGIAFFVEYSKFFIS